MTDPELQDVMEAARLACLSAALRAHEDAGLQGLCADGRWEAAVSAIRNLDLRPLIEARNPPGARP